MDIIGNFDIIPNEAVWVDCSDSASGITSQPSPWIQDYALPPLATSAGTSTCMNYVLDCSGVFRGSINPTYVWCPGSIGTATSADKNNGAKAETQKDIGFDAFAEVLEDAS